MTGGGEDEHDIRVDPKHTAVRLRMTERGA